MNRIFSRVLTLGIALTAIGAALPACAKNDKSLFIRNVVAPPTSRQNGACVYTIDANGPGLFAGVLDIAISQAYTPVMLVGNQLIARADPLDPRAESNRVHLKGFVSRVTDTNGNAINELTGNGSGFADAAANNTPGFGLMSGAIIDANTIAALQAKQPIAPFKCVEVLAQIRVFGTTLGGEDVESGEFQFGVSVCNGKLIKYDTDAAGGTGANCLKAVDPATAATDFACVPGQDEPTDCHVCASGSTVPAQQNLCDHP